MSSIPKPRWLQFKLRTFLLATLILGVWIGSQLRWIHQRSDARAWLEARAESWYAPSLAGARVQAHAPWSLRLFGEQGVVGIGIDWHEAAGEMPFSSTQLRKLFPEARVDVSRDGMFLDDPLNAP